MSNQWFNSKIGRRNLIKKNEDRISYLQIIGLLLMGSGICYLTAFRIYTHVTSPEGLAISFFIIMFGFALAFPSLLKDRNAGLSTMRIIVFMMINVICILLLKLGWQPNIRSLKDIGMDPYWMGVIAFTFGAKATQSFFESSLATPPATTTNINTSLSFTSADIARMAVTQCGPSLQLKFPNILSVSDAVDDLTQTDSHVVALYVKDQNIAGMPDSLNVQMPDGSTQSIKTQIIQGVGAGNIHYNQLNPITKAPLSNGSFCCRVRVDANTTAIITAGHVYSNGMSTSAGGKIPNPNQNDRARLNFIPIGIWYFQLIAFKYDVALALESSPPTSAPDQSFISFAGKSHYAVTDADVTKTQVTLVSNTNQTRSGCILDHNCAWDVDYDNGTFQRAGIVLVGSTNDRTTSKTLSAKGDSGGCVYEPKSGNLVGLILGGNTMYTWVLPLGDVCSKNSFNLM